MLAAAPKTRAAAADAALLSRAVERPVRVQWTRADEHGWDPKGPPQLLAIEGGLSAGGAIVAWRTDMWIPRATANLPNIPLLGPEAAGIAQTQGISTGLISQNGDPPYAVPNQEVTVHWHKSAPLRPSNIRVPGKIANCFAVESFTDELAAAAGAAARRRRVFRNARAGRARQCGIRRRWHPAAYRAVHAAAGEGGARVAGIAGAARCSAAALTRAVVPHGP